MDQQEMIESAEGFLEEDLRMSTKGNARFD
jgi:hypothetical protein